MVGKTVCIGIVLGGFLPAAAMAAGVVYSNRAAFEAAIGPRKTYTFEVSDGFASAPAPITFVDTPFPRASSNGGPASLDLYGPGGNQALTGRSNNQVDRTATLTITPAPLQNAIGFDILDLGSPIAEATTIVVNDATDRPVVPYQIQDNDGNPATPVFFGVIWDVPITSVDAWGENLICAGPGICYTPNLIDNLTVAPEPGVFMMLFLRRFDSHLEKTPSETINFRPRRSHVKPPAMLLDGGYGSGLRACGRG
ncbi:MAG TPA: hypothetical protein VGP94_01325 [Tepidisphaeraceae bacterium]|nr:hypothetical protein [Tepidisphaeraceae bacterium]